MAAFSSDKEFETYERETRIIKERFPDALFTVSMGLDDATAELQPKTHKAYLLLNQGCYKNKPIVCYIKKDRNLYVSDLIDEMIRCKWKTECKHYFLELFRLIDEKTYKPCFGS